METNGRLDLLAANVGEIRESRPDFSSSFVALSGLLESMQANVTDTHDRIDALGELVRDVGGDQSIISSAVAPLAASIDAITAQAAATEQQVAAALESLAESFGRVDAERATAVAQQLDEVRQAVDGLSDRQAAGLMDVLERFEHVSDNVASAQATTLSVEAALRTAAEGGTDERLGELAQQITTLSGDVKSTVRSVVGLAADLGGLRSDLQTFADSMPDREGADVEVRAALARLDTAIAERDQQLRETVERLDAAVGARDEQLREAVARLDAAVSERESEVTAGVARLDATLANRDASVRDILSRLDAAIGETSRESDFSDLARQFDAAIGELRRDLQSMYQAASNTDVVDVVRTLSSEIGDLRSDVQRTESELRGGASAALVSSAASAMSRLEGRMDGEFDSVGHQMEALGTLLAQAIDAVHRIEVQVVGAQPVSDKMRSAAATVLETLRASVRQRADARRAAGAPPELGAGPR
jgi:chromosome segregation ATPase